MKPTTRRLLFWTPRLLCILFAAFISIFALDVFEHSENTRALLLALAMHLIPTALVIGVLALSWRWEWVGGVTYSVMGVYHITWGWERLDWTAFALITGPLFLISALFLIGWRYRAEIRGRREARAMA